MRQLKITKSITNRESASLDKYLQEIGREELITVEEEVELAQRIRKGDRAALEKLTRANLRFVVSVSKQYQNQGLSLPDLINEGHIYIAIPPLYRVGEGKNIKYLYSDTELEKYRTAHPKKFTIQRYKGLGEMDADQLFETTMDVNNRLLKQVSIDSMAEATEITHTLMGSDVAPRRHYIEKHSREANIDL